MNEVRLTDLRDYENDLNFKEINFPVKVKEITKFENYNPDLPGINVFSVDDNNKVYPLRINQKDCLKSLDLFLSSEDEKQHYSLIKNFSRLVRSQITKDTTRKLHICKKCLTHFTKEDLLEKHISYCSKNETVAVKMPAKNTILKFQNHFKKLPIPFAIYADFECFTLPVHSCKPNPKQNPKQNPKNKKKNKESFTQSYQKHEPSGYCLYVKALDGLNTNFKPIVYTKKTPDEDISKKFIKNVTKLTHQIYQNYYKNPKTMLFNSEDQKDFETATKCHICEQKLFRDKETKKILKVRDHCHFTEKYRGAAHNDCNLKCRKPLILPVIFHNLQGYDSHLFIKQLAKVSGDLSTIPSTEEKYISFSKSITVDQYYSKNMGKLLPKKFEIRFIDSFKFLSTSLADLVKNLVKNKNPSDFKNLNRVINHNVSLLTRKGVYPYDYVTSINKLKETKLPSKEAFYSKLLDQEISDEDYQHANKVWNTFNCQTLQDYHDLYLTTDVLLLADVFENFRKTCLKHYKLDPCHYYTAPGLAWDACLKETKQELQLLKDYDMLMMFEQGIRGGISHISKRYAEANNKYMKDFDESKPSTFIQYLDANNLYGWAMTQKLPTHGFKWINVDKSSVLKLLEKKDTNQGFIFEVDLDYPSSLWKSHNDYPLAPERTKIDKVDKLICSFLPKKHYVLHYKNLKQYLKEGMILKKVHRGLKFVQSPWMKPYIRKNTDLRKEAKNAFEKDFFKLMNNSVFGKTIENIRKRQSVKIMDDRKKALKLTSKPNFDRVTIFDEHLVAVHMKKTEVYFNKPIYVGQAILDLSKTLMFDFHYNYIRKKYGNKAELLFTDTDSLMYLIQTEDFYLDINKDVKKKFGTSDYVDNHPSGIKTGVNKNVIGKFKDEAAGRQITHFVGLRPKLYTFKVEEKKKGEEEMKREKKAKGENKGEIVKARGVKDCVIKKSLSFEDYKKCLFNEEKIMREMNIIRSQNHDIYSMTVNKVALSANDDKRLICLNKINTLALRPITNK